MIVRNMRLYDYFTFGNPNSYGQPQLSPEAQGKIKMAISITSKSTQDNILFKDASYLGLTFGEVNDNYVIQYGDKRLKVLYVIPEGRFKQVFLKEM